MVSTIMTSRDGADDAVRLRDPLPAALLDSESEPAFDRALRLGMKLLETPAGLVSFVHKDGQAFKAQIGAFEAASRGKTSLMHAICRSIMQCKTPLAIEDMRRHPLSDDESAFRESNVVACLGVPLASPSGLVLGALCVMQGEPRAWTDDEIETLADIAAGVESEIGCRIEVEDRMRAERRWHAVLDHMPVGVMIGEAPSGALLYQNREATRLLGHEVLPASSLSSYQFLGGLHEDGSPFMPEEYPLARAILSGERIDRQILTYRKGDNALTKLEVSALRMTEDGEREGLAVTTFEDVEERERDRARLKASEARLAAVLTATPDAVFVLDGRWRFTYMNRHARDRIGGGRDLVGQVFWEVFPESIGRSSWHACTEAMQTGREAKADEHDEAADQWIEARAFPSGGGLTVFVRDVTAERKVDEARQLLVRELNHRVKNLFAVMSGMVSMTARSTSTSAQMENALRGRLFALGRAHDLIRPAVTMNDLRQAEISLQNLITSLIEPHVAYQSDMLSIEGTMLTLGANGATSLALIVHELATNAAKYGCLSVPEGSLSVTWREEAERLEFQWTETGGPPIEAEPTSKGFGSKLVRIGVGEPVARPHGSRMGEGWHSDRGFRSPGPAQALTMENGFQAWKTLDVTDKHVLVVEDEMFIAYDLALGVEEAGGKVVGPVDTVVEALEKIEAERIDAAILDVNLLDGEVDPVLLRLLGMGIPVVVHTGTGLNEALAVQLKDVVPIFAKPTNPRVLTASLAKQFGNGASASP